MRNTRVDEYHHCRCRRPDTLQSHDGGEAYASWNRNLYRAPSNKTVASRREATVAAEPTSCLLTFAPAVVPAAYDSAAAHQAAVRTRHRAAPAAVARVRRRGCQEAAKPATGEGRATRPQRAKVGGSCLSNLASVIGGGAESAGRAGVAEARRNLDVSVGLDELGEHGLGDRRHLLRLAKERRRRWIRECRFPCNWAANRHGPVPPGAP
jgi:hypothetical protein